jgi:hypothetical protein
MTPSLVMNELICRSLKSAHWLCGHFILFFSGSEELILIGHIGTAEAAEITRRLADDVGKSRSYLIAVVLLDV